MNRTPKIFLIAAILFAPALSPSHSPAGESPNNREAMSADRLYAAMTAKVMAIQSYQGITYGESRGGKDGSIWARSRTAGRYLKDPAIYCEKRIGGETSFSDLAGEGYQECYHGRDDLIRILMPGALRALGVMTIFPEDPKASFLNGENMRDAGAWTWFKKWDRMREGGTAMVEFEQMNGRKYYLLTITAREPDPVYRHQRQKIWVDPETFFPMKVETWRADGSEPATWFQFEEINLQAGLTEEDMVFEGPLPRWTLVDPPEPQEAASLSREEPVITGPGRAPDQILASLDQALAGVADYDTEMSISLRYRRLRLIKQDRFSFIRRTGAYRAHTLELDANYLIITGGEGFRVIFDPDRSEEVRVLPAGVYKVVGEMTYRKDDPRLFSTMGDSLFELDFFSIRDKLSRWMKHGSVRAARARVEAMEGDFIEVKIKSTGSGLSPRAMRLILDPQTGLPAWLQYTGYDDNEAFLSVKFQNTRANQGIASHELWE